MSEDRPVATIETAEDQALLTSEFDFPMPAELIAQEPIEPRDQCRLLVYRRADGAIDHRIFADLPELLNPGDLLVRNASRVIPARLLGRRTQTGGRWEGLYLATQADGSWELMTKTRGRPQPGERIEVGDGLVLVLGRRTDVGTWTARPESDDRPAAAILNDHGHVPIPPYIRGGIDRPDDADQYQTVYARRPGSVAAPTAGLHFTDRLFDRLRSRGIDWADLTLHVGAGTFQPIAAERIDDHKLHREAFAIDARDADRINQARASGGRLIAVGTTAARTLEAAWTPDGFHETHGETSLYLKPGHAFRGVDALITNFHLPRSSLLVLVAALIGIGPLRTIYDEAITRRYRFYSYGDAMIVL